ncbi:LOW QUALITY PROTEIN: SCO-spondin-like [Lepeophtheirus salmonis]|uniref:LOW QUALITY PROTEIN: SCO-spondin-like n=1 Tax=Lepeophtheirus salmonis TaxID=72036 RepID=UPI003AF38110
MKSLLLLFLLILSFVEGNPQLEDDNDPFSDPLSSRKSVRRKVIIDPQDKVCTPRKDCSKTRDISPSILKQTLAYTDSLNEIFEKYQIFEDNDDLVDIPLDIDEEAIVIEDNTNAYTFEAVEIEIDEDDNDHIYSMKEECTKDQSDYCNGKSFKSSNHTMCQYCGLGPKCPYYLNPEENDVTGRVIEDKDTISYILRLHNEIRSKITRGRCNQPKAGCMGPLQWDPELARVAQKWADQCAEVDYKEDIKRKDPLLYHDKHANRKIDRFSNWQGTGQNVARDISKGKPGIFNAHKLIRHWFNQIRFFDPAGVESFGSGNQCSQGIGYYTQLVWQDTTHVGCGWVQFQYRGFEKYFENFLVCNYGPSANIWKQPVYDIAKDVCNCPCIGCNNKTGLCPANCKYATWSSWESWSSCSTSCGGGSRQRERGCEETDVYVRPSLSRFRVPTSTLILRNNHSDSTNQELNVSTRRKNISTSLCKPGSSNEVGKCSTEACPEWSFWSQWSSCSASCGGGKQSRSRTCQVSSSIFLGVNVTCPGSPEEFQNCNTNKCPELSNWSEWTICTKKCGTGERSRERTCNGEIYPSTQNPCQISLYERELCNNQPCPSYTEWSDWASCSVSCGEIQKRMRSCVLPKFTSNIDLKCEGGPPVEKRDCNSNACPNWSSWGSWSSCSLSCGEGKRRKTRVCGYFDAERMKISDKVSDLCPGNGFKEEKCNSNRCPLLGPWSEWTECSTTCGSTGIRQRTRECGINSGLLRGVTNACQARLKEIESCNNSKCPVYGPWSEWSTCSTTCGEGIQKRKRECSGDFCEGASIETKKCSGNVCPVWTEWSDWTECSVTCGGGKKSKVRECVLPSGERSRGLICPGEGYISKKCNNYPCPELGPWSDWSSCSSSCGSGRRTRIRECGLPITRGSNNNPCLKPLFEIEVCNPQKCPSFSPWSEWSECSVSCGGGYRKKSRECKASSRESRQVFRGNPCHGPLDFVEECNKQRCPFWSSWGEWTSCSQSCNGGRQKRYRECLNDDRSLGEDCNGDSYEEKACNKEACPIYNKWSDWTSCSVSCGSGGLRTKIRTCKRDAPQSCKDEIKKEMCNEDQPCPSWTQWTEWSTCSVTCGGGNQKRIRDCLTPRNLNGSNIYGCDGDTWEMKACNVRKCPQWAEWSSWSECSVTCGSGGRRNRKRECKEFQFSFNEDEVVNMDKDLFCPGRYSQTQSCNNGIKNCPFPGEWSEWSTCSKTCGKGTKKRNRKCIDSKFRNGNPCNADLNETENCNEQDCPVWSPWTEWTECSRSCGKGMRSKMKICLDLTSCSGKTKYMELCNENPCPSLTPWTEWTPCSVSCGGGSQRRERDCLVSRSGFLNPCFEPLEEIQRCNSESCPKWSEWTEWTPCSESCGGGTQTRVRDCVSRSACNSLGDSDKEKRECNVNACPSWTSWSNWSVCSASCGGGTRIRNRECSLNARNKAPCIGDAVQREECNNIFCPSWTQWSEWSECSASCKPGGRRNRKRKCSSDQSKDCTGSGLISEPCNENKDCPSGWSEWGQWSSCSASCGGGSQLRKRECLSPGGRYGPFLESEGPCPGPSEITLFCNLDDCPTVWSEWTPWSSCSSTCGGGSKKRTRVCSGMQCEGNQLETSLCNDRPCYSWSHWGSWTVCSVSCGQGTQKRSRTCNASKTRLGLLFSPCKGDPEEAKKCVKEACPAPGLATLDICKPFGAPNKFGSFSGRPAASTVDCVWDYFACTKRYGSYPTNKACCDARFMVCCNHVMTGGHGSGGSFGTLTTTEPSNSYGPIEEPDNCSSKLMECTKRRLKTDRQCKLEFNECTLLASGMDPSTKRPINDIDLPDGLPEFLRPSISTIKPIQDIDLPQNQEFLLQSGGPDNVQSFLGQPQVITADENFMACLLKHFECTNDCPQLKTCSELAGVEFIEDGDNFGEESVSSQEFFLPPVNFTTIGSSLLSSAEDKERMFCVREFFSCKKSSTECKLLFTSCVDKQDSFTREDLCKGVEGSPENYLIPHPLDCTKFYSCQSLGPNQGYRAHLMDCPFSTGFDKKLKICNFIQSLPRCKDKSSKTGRVINGRLARNGRSEANVGEVGFLTSVISSSGRRQSSSGANYILLLTSVTIVFVPLRLS